MLTFLVTKQKVHSHDQEAALTMAEPLFDKWVCRYGVPVKIITNK